MKKLAKQLITIGVALCLSLTACTAIQTNVIEPTATALALNMPNPASVYCKENGNALVIHTAADGSQTGICIFPDGSTCDEWAYFRGECGPKAEPEPTLVITIEPTKAIAIEPTQKPSNEGVGQNVSGSSTAPETSEPFSDWWGIIKKTPAGAQFDDYFERQDLGGAINFGIDSMVPELQAQIIALRDSGKIVHLYGTLFSNVPDYNGSQVQVERIEVDG